MEIWKINQLQYHALTREHSDDLSKVNICWTDNVVDDAVDHFTKKIDLWIYPSKSFFVAICYAKWISEDFGGDFYEILDDPELLFGNDPYFVPYHKDKATYDAIISRIGLNFDQTKGMVPDVRSYYERECLGK